MTNKGKGSSLALILILIVALIVAWLAVKNMTSLKPANNSTQEQDYVQQAQDAVDAINQRIQQAGQEP